MRYSVADIEDQIIATLKADGALSGVNIRTHAGEVSTRIFLDDQAMQEFVANLPFILLQYQGKRKVTSDSSKQMSVHELTFRLYVGAQSLRDMQEGQRSAYSMLASIYDDLHGRVPKSTPQQLPVLPILSGTAITTSGFNPQSPLTEADGLNEGLIVNMPGIAVYGTNYILKLQA